MKNMNVEKVTVLRAFKSAGVFIRPRDVIEVDKSRALELEKNGLVHRGDSKQAPVPNNKQAPDPSNKRATDPASTRSTRGRAAVTAS